MIYIVLFLVLFILVLLIYSCTFPKRKRIHSNNPRVKITKDKELLSVNNLSYNEKCLVEYNINSIVNDFNTNNKIPKIIYLCYKTKDIPSIILKKWTDFNPGYKIELYDNVDCINFLRKEYNEEYVNVFNSIESGPIKADFWRVCILYRYGGIYCDIDIELLQPFNNFIEKDTNFVTCVSCWINQLNPHIIISEPKFYILKNCIDHYLLMYRNIKKYKYEYWKWSIVHIMGREIYYVFNKYINEDGYYIGLDGFKYQLLKEVCQKKVEDIHCIYNNKRVLNNRLNIYDPNKHQFKQSIQTTQHIK